MGMRNHRPRVRLLLALAPTLLTPACGTGGAKAPPGPPTPIVVDGFRSPESVVHDAVADVYLVSNIDGSPFEADGRGFVSRVAPDGRVLEARFIDGLDAPKGLAVSAAGTAIAVADLTVVKLFDRATGAPRGVVKIPGATFLNDVAAAADGSFYVSDSGMGPAPDGVKPTGSDALFRIAPDGSVSTLARDPALALPNGIAALGDAIVLVSFGDKRVRRFGADGSRQADEIELPAGMSDGVVEVTPGCLAISSFEAPGILAGPRSGPFTVVGRGDLVADLGIDRRRGRLLLPLISEGKLRIVPVEPYAAACRPAGASGG